MVPIVEKANSMKIPVVCIDRSVDKGEVLTTVEFDNWKAGNDAGEFMAKALGGKGKVMQIQGTLGASVVYERGESFRQAIAKHPGLKLVAEPSSKDWTTADALSFTEDALSAHPDLAAIWTHAMPSPSAPSRRSRPRARRISHRGRHGHVLRHPGNH